jgi:hypothetical protein
MAVSPAAEARTRGTGAPREQMRKEAMLFEQAFAIAHGMVMALDEDVWPFAWQHAGRGKWARADGENARGLAERGKLGEERRNSSSVSGGQSGATSVPSMPCGLIAVCELIRRSPAK